MGVGSSYTIDAYIGSTRSARNTAGFSVTPGSNTRYSIGDSKTNEFGQLAGTFVVPSNSTLKFRTGERMFRISNLANGSSNGSTTIGESKFYAQGLIGVSVGVTATRLPQPTYYPGDAYYWDGGAGNHGAPDNNGFGGGGLGPDSTGASGFGGGGSEQQ